MVTSMIALVANFSSMAKARSLEHDIIYSRGNFFLHSLTFFYVDYSLHELPIFGFFRGVGLCSILAVYALSHASWTQLPLQAHQVAIFGNA
jgi:hypothetical protein